MPAKKKAGAEGREVEDFSGVIPSGYVFDGIRLVKAVADKPLRDKRSVRVEDAPAVEAEPDTPVNQTPQS